MGDASDKRNAGRLRQAAALPFRGRADGQPLEVLLVTSRETRRWIVPKGKVDPGMTPPQAAAQEAFEEAGVVGEIGSDPIGSFFYLKYAADGSGQWLEVDLFLLPVSVELDAWKEQHQRERRWFSPAAAAAVVDEPELAAILRGMTARN